MRIFRVLNNGGLMFSENEATQMLKKLGLKVTHPRLNVLKIMKQSNLRHFSAEAIYEAIKNTDKDIGLATVYRILTQFSAVGLVKKLHFEEGFSLFELQSEEHHDHLVCVRCGAVEEFIDELIEQRQHVIAEQKHFKMTDHALVIYGVCKACL